MSGPFVHRLLNDKGRIDQYLTDNLYTVQFPVSQVRIRDIFWQGNYCHFRACCYLPVNSRMASGDILLCMPVNSPDQMCQVFNSLIEGAVWPFIKTVTLGIIDYETVEMPPVVIQIFYKLFH